MNSTKRFLFQVLLWLVIWLVLWSGQKWSMQFVHENLFSFPLQILLVAILIYFTAPKFLFNKKYTVFILVSVVFLVLFSYFATPIPIRELPREPFLPNLDRRPPSRVFTQALLLLIAYILATVVEFIVYAHKKEEEISKSKNQNLQTELKLLKSQINPHFLFNSLNNIYALSAIDATKTQQSISYLSDMLRYVLYECERPYVSLQKEIGYIENYIKLFSLKSSKEYPIKLNVKVLDKDVQIAPMLLIPFVENAFKHSNIEKITDTFIHIDLEVTKENIYFKIENNIAKNTVVKDAVGGIGLENVKRRLAILYPEKHSLEIEEKNGVFQVKLNLEQHV